MRNSSSQVIINHFDFIDAIRGLGALYVVMYHMALIPNPGLMLPLWMTSFILHGDTGVTLFFIVSAFTLANSMNERKLEPRAILRFYLRRIFRILPLFYFLLIFTLYRDYAYFKIIHPIREILLSVTFLFNFFPGKSTGIVWASWTLGIEMVFYFIFPFIFKHVNNFWKSLGFLFLTMFVSAVWIQNLTFYAPNVTDEYKVLSFLYRLPIFAFGLMIFYIFKKITKLKNQPTGISFMLISASILGYFSLISGKINSFGIDDLYWEAAICSLFVLGLALSPIKLFVNKITKFYGEISYSLYLNHPPLVFLLVPIYRYLYTLSMPTTLKYGTCYLLTVIILTLISFLTYTFIEKLGIRLGRSVISKLNIQK